MNIEDAELRHDTVSRHFYTRLFDELVDDMQDVVSAIRPLNEEAKGNELGFWEYTYLDQDGGTKNIQRILANGFNIFEVHNTTGAVVARHGHLAPPNLESLVEERYARHNRRLLKRCGKGFLDDHDLRLLVRYFEAGKDTLAGLEGAESRRKYGRLADVFKKCMFSGPDVDSTVSSMVQSRALGTGQSHA